MCQISCLMQAVHIITMVNAHAYIYTYAHIQHIYSTFCSFKHQPHKTTRFCTRKIALICKEHFRLIMLISNIHSLAHTTQPPCDLYSGLSNMIKNNITGIYIHLCSCCMCYMYAKKYQVCHFTCHRSFYYFCTRMLSH